MLQYSTLFLSYSCTGTYILRIIEVTDPPYLGSRLPDFHVEVKVVPQKAGKEVSLEKLMRSKSKLKV